MSCTHGRARMLDAWPFAWHASMAMRTSAMKAADSTQAVVVPSPAVSLVLEAAWRTSLAPMFSTGSSSSTSLAMVTPSLTILGEPYLDSSTTLRPWIGPGSAWRW
jgi:hypothetical protein